MRGRQGEGNVCLRWALWWGMQQEELPAWQTLVFGLHFPDPWAVPTVSAVTASSHAATKKRSLSSCCRARKLPAPSVLLARRG